MSKQTPSRLYKYQAYSARSLTALKVRTVWFGQPSELNDPFDCAVPVRLAPITIGACERLLQAKSDARWAQVRESRENVGEDGRPTEAFRALVERVAREKIQEWRNADYVERGVTCFSESPDNTLLWSHYGDGHRGICLEFDTSSEFFGLFHPIDYAEAIPEIDALELLLGNTRQVLAGLLTKAQCWSYEREWRAIHKVARTEYCYGIDALTAVYLGAALTPAEKDVVAHLVHGTATQLFEMRRSETEFGVKPMRVHYAPYVQASVPAV